MTSRHVGLHDLVPRRAAEVIRAFARAKVREGRLHSIDEARLAEVVAAVQAAGRGLTGRLLAQWLAEDVGWPAALTSRLACELDRGLVLTAYDELRRRP